ncbi:hypothetical protein OG350_26000 [Streptomyces achromogenes]|uniref:Uncharacterized protein n=1 Tax=Streptomyces achromogenes TaxID=67255 RepID=A0ABZ1KZR9_STRAH
MIQSHRKKPTKIDILADQPTQIFYYRRPRSPHAPRPAVDVHRHPIRHDPRTGGNTIPSSPSAQSSATPHGTPTAGTAASSNR